MFLKNATVMRVEGMPQSVLLNEENFQQHVPIPDGSTTPVSYGFVVNPISKEWWHEFEVADKSGVKRNAFGLQFCIEEKVVPGYQLKALLDKKLKEISNEESRHIGRKEKEEYRESILIMLLQKSPIRKTSFPVFIIHNGNDEQTIISSATGKNANRLENALVKSFGSIKFKIILFDGLTQGLSNRLTNHIAKVLTSDRPANKLMNYSPTFHPYLPYGNLLIQRKNEKIRMQISDVEIEALLDFLGAENKWEVTELMLRDWHDESVAANIFKIDRNFRFKSIKWADVEIEQAEGEDLVNEWFVLATIRCAAILGWVDTFSEMFMLKTYDGARDEKPATIEDDII